MIVSTEQEAKDFALEYGRFGTDRIDLDAEDIKELLSGKIIVESNGEYTTVIKLKKEK